MNILNYLNVSNPSNPLADSGYVFQKLLMKEILRLKSDWKFYFVCSKGTEQIDERIVNIPLLEYENKYQIRFGFHWDAFREGLQAVIKDVDLVHMNQPEHGASLHALLSTFRPRNSPPFVSYYNYTPVQENNGRGVLYDPSLDLEGLGMAIFLKQIEGSILSRRNVTCSRFGARLLEGSIQDTVARGLPFLSIPPPVSFEEVRGSGGGAPFEKFTIVFNNRLYRHYGAETVFEWLSEFYEKNKGFQVILTDPTNGRSGIRQLLDPTVDEFKRRILAYPFVDVRHCKTREEYYGLLKQADCGIGPFRPSALWSMSVVDMMACRKPVLCLAAGCFPEILGEGSELLVGTKEEFFQRLEALLHDASFYRRQAGRCYRRAREFDVRPVARKFIGVFENGVEEAHAGSSFVPS